MVRITPYAKCLSSIKAEIDRNIIKDLWPPPTLARRRNVRGERVESQGREDGIRGDVDRPGEFRATWPGYLRGENSADVTKNHFFSYAMFYKKIFVCSIIIGINIWSTQNAKQQWHMLRFIRSAPHRCCRLLKLGQLHHQQWHMLRPNKINKAAPQTHAYIY